MSSEDILNMIKNVLELNTYESRIFLTLAVKGSMRISDLSRETEIPRTKIYQVIKELNRKGIVTIISKKPYIVELKDPAEILREKIEREYKNKKELSEKILSYIEKARSYDVKSVRDIAHVTIIDNHENFIKNLSSDIERSEDYILVVVSRTPIEINWRNLLKPLFKTIMRGVAFRYIAPPKSRSLMMMNEIIKMILHREDLSMIQRLLDIDYKDLIKDVLKKDPDEINRILSRVELYEAEIDLPFILFDDKITYILFSDPVMNRFLFSTRYVNERLTKTLREYIELVLASKKASDTTKRLHIYQG